MLSQTESLRQITQAELAREIAARKAARSTPASSVAGPAEERWTTRWVHVYDADGEWLATFEYDESNPEERDLAEFLAAQTRTVSRPNALARSSTTASRQEPKSEFVSPAMSSITSRPPSSSSETPAAKPLSEWCRASSGRRMMLLTV
jgi:hypothetical protein